MTDSSSVEFSVVGGSYERSAVPNLQRFAVQGGGNPRDPFLEQVNSPRYLLPLPLSPAQNELDPNVFLYDTEHSGVDEEIDSGMISPAPTVGQYPSPEADNCQILGSPLALEVNIGNIQQQLTTGRLESRIAAQQRLELQLLEEISCSHQNPKIIDNMQVRTFLFDDVLLDNAENNPTSSGFQDNLTCLIEARLTNTEGWEKSTRAELLRHWFPNFHLLPLSSKYGRVFTASFSDNSSLFAIKVPQNPKRDDLIHEALVGRYMVPIARKFVPNFVYVYGYARASPVAVDADSKLITWATSDERQGSYLITENIRDSMSLLDWVRTATPAEVVQMFLQIENALHIAFNVAGFVHYDLHLNNVLVRTFPNPIAIPFYGSDGEVWGYLYSKHIGYIIDYGFSRVLVKVKSSNSQSPSVTIPMLQSVAAPNSQSPSVTIPMLQSVAAPNSQNPSVTIPLGNLRQLIRGKDPAVPYPLLDTGGLLYRLSSINSTIKAVLTPFTAYFSQPLVLDVGKFRSGKPKTIPNPAYRDLNHDDYVGWLLQTQSAATLAFKAKPTPEEMLPPDMDSCAFYAAYIRTAPPRDLVEFVQVMNALQNDNIPLKVKTGAIAWLATNFDAAAQFEALIPQIAIATDEIAIYLGQSSPNNQNTTSVVDDLPELTPDFPFADVEATDNYRKAIYRVLALKEIATLLATQIRAAIAGLTFQQAQGPYSTRLETYTTSLNNTQLHLDHIRDTLENNRRITQYITWSKTSPTYNFWKDEHGLLLDAF